ncbi:MAG: hypothetical protein KIT31_43030, partial [Deltaproteobacteria bacterium]|nr:hypothetical protein [Deltaproteobacteria bacterium]
MIITSRALMIAMLVAVGCGPTANAPDAGGGTDGGKPDAPTPGGPCGTTSECPTGQYCAQSPSGNLCTYRCDMGAANPCPPGWGCRVTSIDGEQVSVCLPPQFDLCTSCTDDSKCQNGACINYGGESSCLPACGGGELGCPPGFDCAADPTGQHAGLFCVPQTGSCTCTSAADDGMVRTCSTTNGFGTCLGLETCRPAQGGWVGCSAPTAAAEACDGTDNNCNGIIDEGFGGSACTNTNAFGSCPGTSLCTGAGGLICQGQVPKAELCNGLDDNCDGNIDEIFPDLATPCTQGVGACRRSGVVRCTAAGDGTTCSATAGAPSAETCNNLDDDCDGATDEDFPTKGQACSSGLGQCARQGTTVCSASGTGTTCSATAGTPTTDVCNLLDDDCDGKVDEDFRNAAGVYNQDTACGSCVVDCTAIFAVPNAAGHCVVTGTIASCAMVCDPGKYDLDGDLANGCEFVLDPDAIYVSISDAASADDATCGLGPANTEPGHHPCRTIGRGIARAAALNRSRILVANGIYDEAVAIPNGRSLLGGFAFDNWQRNIAATDTNIVGSATQAGHDHAVSATNISLPTRFEGFVVLGPVNTKPSGNSYAVYVSAASTNLRIENNILFAGNGGPGGSGGAGAVGTSGGNGAGRIANLGQADTTYDAHNAFGSGACNASNNRQLSNGGTNPSCATTGGAGGGNRCPASTASVCTNCGANGCSSCSFTTATSIDGFTGQGTGGGAGGVGAARGSDMISGPFASNFGFLCYIPSGLTYGSDGSDGGAGGHGSGGTGCSATVGTVVGGNWSGG